MVFLIIFEFIERPTITEAKTRKNGEKHDFYCFSFCGFEENV